MAILERKEKLKVVMGSPTAADELLLWMRIVKQAYAKRRITYAKFWESHQVSHL